MKPSGTDMGEAERLAKDLHRKLEIMIEHSSDYDVTRILKRTEAELMDLRHNLSLIRRLLGKSK